MKPIRVDVTAERTEKGDLRYPTHLFAVWRDGPDGPLPYHQDTDSYEHLSQALREACTWVHAAAGNEACVLNRVTGRIMARYRQTSSGALGFVFYAQQGRVAHASNRQICRGSVRGDRKNVAETLIIDREKTCVLLEWSHYAATRRYLLMSLREKGEQVDGLKPNTLRALLQHYDLELSDEVTEHPGVNVGTVLFPRGSYNAESIRYLLSCMSRFVYSGSHLAACLGGRQVKITFGWRDYLHIDPTDEQKELDRAAQSLRPCYQAVAVDGLSCGVHAMSQFDMVALDVLLWHILFTEGKDELQKMQGEHADLRRSACLEEATSLVVPKVEEDERLQILIQLESRFFTDAWTDLSASALSPAQLTQLNVRSYVEDLFQEHWYDVVTLAKTFLLCE